MNNFPGRLFTAGCITVLCLCLLWPASIMGDNGRGEKPKEIIRPIFKNIYSYIVYGTCMLKKNTRKELAAVIKELDLHHARFLDHHGFRFVPPPDAKKHIKSRTGFLPSWLPRCERGILYALFLQKDMLDKALFTIDREKAAGAREKRSKKRVLRGNEFRIYGDYRDVYFLMIMGALKDITDLHACFGIGAGLDFSFPKGLKKEQAVPFILEKIKDVTEAAAKLNHSGKETESSEDGNKDKNENNR